MNSIQDPSVFRMIQAHWSDVHLILPVQTRAAVSWGLRIGANTVDISQVDVRDARPKWDSGSTCGLGNSPWSQRNLAKGWV